MLFFQIVNVKLPTQFVVQSHYPGWISARDWNTTREACAIDSNNPCHARAYYDPLCHHSWMASYRKERRAIESSLRLSGSKEVTKHWLSVTILFQIESGKLPIFPFFNHSATDLLFWLVNQIWTFHVLVSSNFLCIHIIISAISFHFSRKIRPFLGCQILGCAIVNFKPKWLHLTNIPIKHTPTHIRLI